MGDHQSGLQVSRILDTTSSPRGLERTKSGVDLWVPSNSIPAARLHDPKPITNSVPFGSSSKAMVLVTSHTHGSHIAPPPASALVLPLPTSVATGNDSLQQAASIVVNKLRTFDTVTSFIQSRQQSKLEVPLPLSHPAAALARSYVTNGFLVKIEPP